MWCNVNKCWYLLVIVGDTHHMSGRILKRSTFLSSCIHRTVDLAKAETKDVEILVEGAYNILHNPKVLLSTEEFKVLKHITQLLGRLAATRNPDTAAKLLTQLSKHQLATLARVTLEHGRLL